MPRQSAAQPRPLAGALSLEDDDFLLRDQMNFASAPDAATHEDRHPLKWRTLKHRCTASPWLIR